jgi:integrase
MPIATITPPLLLATLRKIEERGLNETAKRANIWVNTAFRYAITSGWLTINPAAGMSEALAPVKRGHMASILDGTSSLLVWEKRLGDLLRMFNAYQGTEIVRTALRVLPYVFVRPLELRTARWEDIDLDAGEWRFLVSKTQTEHLVPLAPQVVALLTELRPRTLKTGYIFPSARGAGRPMSENAILVAMRAMGIEKTQMTGHGFRSVARTLLAERLKYSDQLIEMQLAHSVRDVHGRAYNRTQWIDERTEMMQAWADYLDGLRDTGRF